MKDIISYEGLYSLDIFGNVYSEHKKGFLTPIVNPQTGYIQVDLWKNNKGTRFYIHRLLALHYLPLPDDFNMVAYEVNHINGVRDDNSLTNLEWVTSSGNSLHAVRTALRVYTNRLTREEFIDCLHAVIGGESYQTLSSRVPYKVPFLSVKLRKLAKELDLEDALDTSLRNQRAARNRAVLHKINAKRVTTIP